MRPTDQMLARISAEIEQKQEFIDGIVEAAEKDSRDLTPQEMEMVTRSRTRQGELNDQAKPMQEAAEIALQSQERIAQIGKLYESQNGARKNGPVEYRSAGAYLVDRYHSQLGNHDATERLDLYHRAAAHQTTADNAGLLPESILGPVINFIDASRPLVTALGARNLPSGNFSRPKVTQNTQVAAQGGEKTELVSRKMLITKQAITPVTMGGYVNISAQDIRWSEPGIMDIVIQDLAAQYAIETENKTIDDLVTAATTGPVIPTGVPAAGVVAAAFWTAVASVWAVTKGQGRVFAVTGPDMLGLLGPLFPPVNPQNAQSQGFMASDFSTGAVGQIAGVPIYVTAGAATNTMLVLSSAAAEVYEDRLGALQVVEPSVLGTQVAYAGLFADIALYPTAIIKVTKTP